MNSLIFALCITIATVLAHPAPFPGEILTPTVPAGQMEQIQFRIMNGNHQFLNSSNLMIENERKIHVFVIGSQNEVVWHLHPEDFGSIDEMSNNGFYWVNVTFPYASSFNFYVSFAMEAPNGVAVLGFYQFVVNSTGVAGPTGSTTIPTYPATMAMNLKGGSIGVDQIYTAPIVLADEINPVGVSTTAVSLSHMIMSGSYTNMMDMNIFTQYDCLQFTVTVDGNTGLVPYLAAAMHILVVYVDQAEILHVHGTAGNDSMMMTCANEDSMEMMAPMQFGPNITFVFSPEQAGTYVAFFQFVNGETAPDTLLTGAFKFHVVEPSMTTETTMSTMTTMTMSGMVMGAASSVAYSALLLVLSALLFLL